MQAGGLLPSSSPFSINTLMLIMLHADKLRCPPEEEEQNVATPTDGLILEAENIAEVHKILYYDLVVCLMLDIVYLIPHFSWNRLQRAVQPAYQWRTVPPLTSSSRSGHYEAPWY